MGSSTAGTRAGRRIGLERLAKAWRRAPEVLACARQIIEWRPVTLAYLGLRDASYPLTIHFRSGDRVRLDTYHDLVTVWVVFLREEYRVSAHFRSIVDAGANIGMFALYAARRAPNAVIHALEPFPSTRERLLTTLRDNGLESRVKVYSSGLAGSESPRFMSPSGPSQSRGTVAEAAPEAVAVETMTLGRFLEEADIPHGSLLKMDIEGAEHEVLAATQGAALRRFEEIALEYHPNGSRDLLFDKLRTSGFTCRHDRNDAENTGVAHFIQTGAGSDVG